MPSLVSVIMPVYKVEKYLEKSVKSVTDQTHKDLQIILVNDGSPDKCGEICDALAEKDSRITVIHKENGGVSSARNAGLDIAEGKWIYFMDSDDTIEPETIEKTVNMAESTDTDMCFFDYNYEGEISRRGYTLATKKTAICDLSSEEAMNAYNIAFNGYCWTFIIKADAVKGKLRFNESLEYCEDMHFRLSCYANISSFSYIPEVFYHYIVRKGSASHSSGDDYGKKGIALYNELISLEKKYSYPPNLPVWINTHLVNFIGIVAEKCIGQKNSLHILSSFTDSAEYRSALKNYYRDKLNKTARTYLLLRKFGKFSLVAVIIGKNLKKIGIQ